MTISKMESRSSLINRSFKARLRPIVFVLLLMILLPAVALGAETVKFGVLLVGDTRLDTFEGFKAAIAEHAANTGETIQYLIKNAGGERSRLEELAGELIAERPNIVIAAGGIEADALKISSAGTGIPVVFLAASSAEKRGLVASMRAPGGNLTGIDTNDTALVEKRLWYIKKLLPEARRVLVFNVPSLAPSVASVALARRFAKEIELELQVIDVADKEQTITAAAAVRQRDTDVILLLPLAVTDSVIKEALLPLSRREGIPIMGYNEQSVELGAFAAYGSSRRECGAQAARMAIKVVHGVKPSHLPVETPENLSLSINRRMVEELGLKLTSRSWRLADQVVELNP